MSSIAIVPARSGSKGLPDKNIKPLCGKPMLVYSVEAALRSNMFDTVHVSTDSEQYAYIAQNCGADVPFLRSAENSSDTASSWDTVLEVIRRYAEKGERFDTLMLLQPTSPLRTAEDISAAFAVMEDKKADSVVSVCQGVYHHKLPPALSMTGFISDREYDRRRQDAAAYYRVNGAIFLTKTAFFLNKPNIYRGACFAYVMDKRRSVDIDDELDFIIAEAILRNKDLLK